jgi:RNase P protein component
MLPKKRRLTALQVREVLSAGKGVRGGVVSLKYVAKQGFFGVAVVAPKSVARRAVDRNRLRRALYRTLASLSPAQASALNNAMAVFFIRSVPSPLAPRLKEEITDILKKLPQSHV